MARKGARYIHTHTHPGNYSSLHGSPYSLTISPSVYAGAIASTQQLTATIRDIFNDVVTGLTVAWSSSNPAIATVSATGLVTIVSSGTATITATASGVMGTASIVPALVLTLDWAPLTRLEDLAEPLVFLPRAVPTGDGYATFVTHVGSPSPWAVNRITYPILNEKWTSIGEQPTMMADTWDPDWKYASEMAELVNQGPYYNTTAYTGVLSFALFSRVLTNTVIINPAVAMDEQDIASYKRGVAISIKAKRPTDVGKMVRLALVNNAPFGDDWPTGLGAGRVIKTRDVALTASWAKWEINFDNYAQHSGLNWNFVVTPLVDDTGITYAMYGSAINHMVAGESASTWMRPKPWHRRLGLLSQFQAGNSWGADCDLPTLFGGASRTSDGASAPDADDYYGGRVYGVYSVPTNGGFTTDAPYLVEETQDVVPTNTAAYGVWLHVRFKPAAGNALPLDTDFVGYLTAQDSGRVYGPIAMLRDSTRHHCEIPSAVAESDGTQFFRARFQVNRGVGTIVSGTASGGNYIFTTSAAHNIPNGARVVISGYSVGALNGVHTVTAVTSTTLTIVGAGANGVDGTVSEASLNFTPQIRNVNAGTITVQAYRLGMTNETTRNYGWHNAWVPKRCVTGRVINDAAFEDIPALQGHVTRAEGFYVSRYVFPYALEEVTDLNGNATDAGGNNLSPEFFQSGPFGSADFSFHGAVSRSQTLTNGTRINFSMERGAPAAGGDYDQWNIDLNFPEGTNPIQAFDELDVAIAWKAGLPVAFGLGIGDGTAMTWYENGDTPFGGTCVIGGDTSKLDWELDGNWDGDSHLGLAADRDRIRQTGGWQQAAATGVTVSPATVRASIEAYIINRLGARRNHRSGAA